MIFRYRAMGLGQANCYIVGCSATHEAVVIDPGADDPWIERTLQELGLTLVQIVLTHGHIDHIVGVPALKARHGAPVVIHPAEAAALTDPSVNFSSLFGQPFVADPADAFLNEGDVLRVGTTVEMQVVHTPGHSPGSVSLIMSDRVISGDALFAGSIGRTDLPGGDFETLIRSIKEKLLTLPADTQVFPGHGPPTTVADEKAYNPFVA